MKVVYCTKFTYYLILLQEENTPTHTSHHDQDTSLNIIDTLDNTQNLHIPHEIIEMEDSLDTQDSESVKHTTSSPSAEILSENPPSVSSSEHGSQPCVNVNKKNVKMERENARVNQASSWPLPIIADQVFNAQDFLQIQSTSQDNRHLQASSGQRHSIAPIQNTRQSLTSPQEGSGKYYVYYKYC